jgi:hypothetical protein
MKELVLISGRLYAMDHGLRSTSGIDFRQSAVTGDDKAASARSGRRPRAQFKGSGLRMRGVVGR